MAFEQMVGGVGTWPWRSNGHAFRTNDEAFPSWQGSIRNVAIRGQVSVGQRLSITGRARGGEYRTPELFGRLVSQARSPVISCDMWSLL